MADTEKTAEQEWREHFDELVLKFKEHVYSVELLSQSELKFRHGDVISTEEELSNFVILMEKCSPQTVTLSYAGKRFIFIKELENAYSNIPFFLFVSREEDSPGVKRGLILADYFGFILVATFNNSNAANVVRFFCNYVSNTVSQYNEEEE